VESTGSCISYLRCVLGILVCVSDSLSLSLSFRLHAYHFFLLIPLAWDQRGSNKRHLSPFGCWAWGLASSRGFWTRTGGIFFFFGSSDFFPLFVSSFLALCTPTWLFGLGGEELGWAGSACGTLGLLANLVDGISRAWSAGDGTVSSCIEPVWSVKCKWTLE
jgi:hypothetical protein